MRGISDLTVGSEIGSHSTENALGREGRTASWRGSLIRNPRSCTCASKFEVTVSSFFQTLRKLEGFASGTMWQKNSPRVEVAIIRTKRHLMHRSTASMLFVLAALLMAISFLCPPAQAADSACQVVSDVGRKVLTTPTHIYTTRTAAFRSGDKPTMSETIYAGGAIYVRVNDHWTRSTITPQDMLQQKKDNQNNSKMTCRYLREESVNGEAAAVYSTHTETEDDKVDVQVWISKIKGLPLREELDVDVGGNLGKSHSSMRYEYGNVQPPRL